jgi:hypothetical protein
LILIFKENNKLIRFNISWNGFENNGAEAIGKALTHNVVLQELDIKCNRIGPTGFAKVCAALKDNTSLKKLYVRHTQKIFSSEI